MPPSVLSGPASFDAGLVDALSQPEASHIFSLTNATKSPLVLASIRGSCGCEHLGFLVAGKELPSTTVAPGLTVQVSVHVRLRGQPATELTKTAWIVGADGKILDTLTLSFKVRQPFVVQPAHLDLGDIPAGATKAAQVTVEVDNALLSTGTFPPFTSDTPGISATQSGVPSKVQRDGKPGLSAAFTVTAAHPANIGPFAAMLNFSLTSPSTGVETVFLPVSGNVVGGFAASPKSVNFGAVASGAVSVRDLIVTGNSSHVFAGLTFQSSSPWVTVASTTNQDVNSSSCSVAVTLSGKAPAGKLQASITLSAGPEQNLVIPVTADVVTTY